MGEQENKIIAFLLQNSTILGFLAFVGIVWGVAFPEAKVAAILEVAAIFLALHQFAKDTDLTAFTLVNWIFQPTTLRALILSGSVILGRVMPELTIEKIVAGATALLGLLEMFRDEVTGKLIFAKK